MELLWIHHDKEVELYILLDGGGMDKERTPSSVNYVRNDILVVIDDTVTVDIERLYSMIVPDEALWTFEEGPSFFGPGFEIPRTCIPFSLLW